MTDSLAPIVAQHYNQIQEKGLEERKQSRIFHMRNLNNWVKSMLIKEFAEKLKEERDRDKKIVLDIGAGKGGDLLKWKKGGIDYLVCADIAETSVEQCKQRYMEMKDRHKRQRERGYCFDAEFITADCTKQRLKDLYQNPDIQFNIVSIQFAFHYCFESLAQARTMLQNVSECLKPGGYFIGTLPDAYEIMKRLEDAEDCTFGNDVYSISFPSKDIPKLFGAKYDFHLEGVVDCPEFLVYFPAFLKLAEEVDLELLYSTPFADYFDEKQKIKEGQFLLTKMQSLETYPPFLKNQVLMGCDDEYYHAKEKLKLITSDKESDKDHVGTLSQSEWEVASMYVVFAFRKKEKTVSA
ncbi:mRNA cap guanine-N(7) methyltransferase [Parasteatoda tepidariorum]|uniref:mRNA cap guanine-N(7) methyltransferase n=2 Tax=Parasteatoda tepidariorum TaxID=114398 RepID=A0A2L2XZN2_PARTP|nr:mRNA cap guanine-N7 methyltransferase [Parasteatoda tepidariorum]XP_042901008.1 mRNA cap guanine-N7 methyltransferase [Parasteatoda tepidariorum]